MIQLKYLSHCKIPIMVSHGAGHIFDYHWERENIFVYDKELLVIDVNCVVEVLLQVKMYLVNSIIRSDSSSSDVQSEESSHESVCEVFMPK